MIKQIITEKRRFANPKPYQRTLPKCCTVQGKSYRFGVVQGFCRLSSKERSQLDHIRRGNLAGVVFTNVDSRFPLNLRFASR